MTDEPSVHDPAARHHPEVEVPEVDRARELLTGLAATPVHGHPAVFDDIQRLLTTALEPEAGGAASDGAQR